MDNKLVLTVNVTMLNEDLVRGENGIRDIGFPIEEMKKGLDWMGGWEVLLWTLENFSDFIDVLKEDEMTSTCFFLDGRKFWIGKLLIWILDIFVNYLACFVLMIN